MAKQSNLFLTVNGYLTGTKVADSELPLTNPKTILTAGNDGSLVKAVSITSTDATAQTVRLYFGATGAVKADMTLLVAKEIPVEAGTDGVTLPVNLLNKDVFPSVPLDNAWNPILHVPAGQSLFLDVDSLSSSTEIHVSVLSENF